MGCIYKIFNKTTDKVYIGQTSQPIKNRLNQHMSSNLPIGLAIKKYGIDSFEIIILENNLDQSDLNDKEYQLIKLYNCIAPNGYNLREGGRNSLMSQEAKDKLSKANSGKKQSKETIKKRSAALLGKARSEDTKNKISLKQRGVPKNYSPEIIQKMRLAKLGKKRTSESILKCIQKRKGKPHPCNKPIISTNIQTGIEICYKGSTFAAINGFNAGHITQCCKGISKSHKGYFWRYA